MAKITDFAVPGSVRKASTPALKKKAPPKKKRAKYEMTRPMKSQVQKLIDSNLESNQITLSSFGGSGNTYITHNFSYNPRYQTAVAGQRDLMKLIAPLEQGVQRDDRIGAEVKLMSLRSRFHFYIPTDVAQRDDQQHLSCRLLVLSPKKLRKYSDLVGQWESGTVYRSNFLKPDSEASGFVNDMFSLDWRVNRELMTVHADKRFSLSRGKIYDDGSGSGGHIPCPFKTINISLKVKSKKLLFSDFSDEGASNWAPFAILLISPSTVGQGSVPSTNDRSNVYGNCSTVMTYKA